MTLQTQTTYFTLYIIMNSFNQNIYVSTQTVSNYTDSIIFIFYLNTKLATNYLVVMLKKKLNMN